MKKVIKIMWVKTQIAKCKKVYLHYCLFLLLHSFSVLCFCLLRKKEIFHIIRLDLCFTSSFKTNIRKYILYSHKNGAVRQRFPVHPFVLICF